MMILDTNVVSELMKEQPDPSVFSWVSSYPSASLFTTVITQAEILYGIMLLPAGKRRNAFEESATLMFNEDFSGRVLSFGPQEAKPYAQIASLRSNLGRPISHFDAQIAAIAHTSGAKLLTRNTRDFERCGITVVNPWKSTP